MEENGVFYCEEVVIKPNYTDMDLLLEVFVVTINPRMASVVLEKLSTLIPLEVYGLSHLKRMRAEKYTPNQTAEKQLTIIICPVDKFDTVPIEIQALCSSKQVVVVCKVNPETKEEFSNWSVHWPMNFHPTQLEKDREKGFTPAELDTMKQSVSYLKQDEFNNRHMTDGVYCIGAVVVNPCNGRVVMTSNASLRHMIRQSSSDSTPSSSSSGISWEHIGNSSVSSSSHLSTLLSHPLYTPTMLCVEGVAAVVRGEVDCKGE
jgi:hypothetical protein